MEQKKRVVSNGVVKSLLMLSGEKLRRKRKSGV